MKINSNNHYFRYFLFLLVVISSHSICFSQDFIYKKKIDKFVFRAKDKSLNNQFYYDDVSNNWNGTWIVYSGDSVGLFSREGKLLGNQLYNDLRYFDSMNIRIKKGNKFGLFDIEANNFRLPIIYDFIDYSRGDSALVKLNSEWIKIVGPDSIRLENPPLAFYNPDRPIVFPGCEGKNNKCNEKKMLETIYGQIKYPATAREHNIEGVVLNEVIIDESGSLETIRSITTLGGGIDEEVLRVLNLSFINLKPGKVEGKPVKTIILLETKFKLE